MPNPARFFAVAALAVAMALLANTPALAASFEEGNQYIVVAEEPSAEPKVMEFFSYGCGGCFTFDSWFQRMKAEVGENVEVQYIPADFGGGFWTPAQELFLVMEALGKREQLHDAVFQFIHGERNPITEASARRFMANHGVSEEEYNKVRNSFAVHVKEKRYDQLLKRYRIGSTPTVIVNGKYQVDHTKLSGPAEFVELVKYLLTNP
ncbi:MAG TPA: thiol:disulfide interchange protein DsbA/DsbL [Gammaproteobacteria bacterium]